MSTERVTEYLNRLIEKRGITPEDVKEKTRKARKVLNIAERKGIDLATLGLAPKKQKQEQPASTLKKIVDGVKETLKTEK